jgi:hypothetical protein
VELVLFFHESIFSIAQFLSIYYIQQNNAGQNINKYKSTSILIHTSIYQLRRCRLQALDEKGGAIYNKK